MDVPEETLQQMRAVKAALDDLEQHMQPFLEAAPKEISTQLTPLERVKVHLALAQAVVTLYQLHRRLDAANLENHPLQKELERLAAYERKVKKAITADDLARSRPGASLNIAAANRFIDAAIPDLTAEQKQQLRTLGKQVQQQQQGASCKAADSINDSNKRHRHQLQDSENAQQKEANDSDSDEDRQPQQIQVQQGSSKKQKRSKRRASGAQAADVDAQEFLQGVLADLDDAES